MSTTKKTEKIPVVKQKWKVTTRTGVTFIVQVSEPGEIKNAAMPTLKRLGLDFATGVSMVGRA